MKTSIYFKKAVAVATLVAMSVGQTMAQGGNGVTGINAANTSLRQYVGPVSTLCLAIGAIVGIIGGVRVYIKWNSGDQDINKEIMGWGGSCLFLVLVGTIIKAFFGV
uniref:DUF4134 domain-containing protein n=1 Tax=Pedobacter sp. TaxID=1411316 RepID=UPI001597B9CA|nr:DUF4134 domain-containing protein [Pedobacter sp.]QJS06239.1 conjugal transfer protein, TraE [Pedobacter sp.]